MSDSSDASRHQLSGSTSEAELRAALRDGDPEQVLALIRAGADIHYIRNHGYDALVDAAHGHDVARDPRLLELLTLLVDHGVRLSGVTEYEESGLRKLSDLGRFDAVRLLLDAGADKSHIEWTPLIEAVALGSLADVRAALGDGALLEERDWWLRTAWLIAVLAGDIDKAKLLLERGADPNARGNCGCPPLFYAIQNHHPNVLRWLLGEGMDVSQCDDFGKTALIAAVEGDDLECVEILLGAGAKLEEDANDTAISHAGSREIITRLLDAGADPADLSCQGQRLVIGLPDVGDNALAAVSPHEFLRAFTHSFGEGNPERRIVPFWEAMIRCGLSAYHARRWFEERCGSIDDPIWCAARYGQSLTLLPDGRAVQIGGEHEDYYDPDFCIYNDVFVHERDGSVAIYGYPNSVFPPTDFHTATLVDDSIYVIGSLGYQGTRRFGETPIYRLDVRTFRIDRLNARGEAPGWIYKHRAALLHPQEIRVWGGTVVIGNDSEESHQKNTGSFVLDLSQLHWRRE